MPSDYHVAPANERAVRQLDLFRERLPRRPYCTDELHAGLVIRAAQQAIKSRYIQPNHPIFRAWIVLDVDRPGGAFDWYDLGAPAPNIVAENPRNRHAHLFYGLETPIYADPLKGSVKALRYAAAVEYGLVEKIGADKGYSGLIAKNPLHKAWIVQTYEQWLYDLDWLADFVDLPEYNDLRRRLPDYGLGRNCTLFDNLRRYAYREVKRHWSVGFQSFFDDVETEAAAMNTRLYEVPLDWQEVRHVVKSVAKWTWKHMTPGDFQAIQAARSRKAAAKRSAEAAERAQQVFAFVQENPGLSKREAARKLGIPWSTFQRLLESGPPPISDNSTGGVPESALPELRERWFSDLRVRGIRPVVR